MADLERARAGGSGQPLVERVSPTRSRQHGPTQRAPVWHSGSAGSLVWVTVVLLLGATLAWEIAARREAMSTLLFPAPSTTLATFGRLVADGSLPTAVGATLRRVGGALLLGGVSGLGLGLLIGWQARLRSLVDPLIALTHPIPKIALLPVFLLIFGIGETAILALVSMTAFFPMAINSMAGVRQINPGYFAVAASYRASRRLVLRRVVFPASLPFALAGLRLALNSTLVVTIAVELVSASSGLGATIWMAWETLRTEELYATLLLIAAIGVTGNAALAALERWVAPWRDS